ncbi:MAG TPA: FixH family protein [Candidatus Polarisedimenticolaceae bacterium]|nr:FixH family protein [Candidatus Polarisedimenticolaceae bacterium]
MTRGWIWPLLLGGLLVTGVGVNLLLLVVATGDPSFAVERDYYQKGMEWDRTLAQGRANARLGWTLACGVRAGTLSVVLQDRSGTPITGAVLAVEAFHNARAGQVVTGRLVDAGNGAYERQLPIVRPGLWEMRFRAVRGQDVFTQTTPYEVAR